ncbi:MAG: transcription antitermination factor NusB [Clostridia bacterium]|nr:transcription antitermination factor NusB [Clostridia bacterium]
MTKMKRREAREALFALLFEMSFATPEEAAVLYETECQETDRDLDDDYIRDGYKGALENLEKIDELISSASKGWKIARLARVTLALLRLGVYEMCFAGLPYHIAINEAVELAKVYGEDKSPGFINGVLNQIAILQGLKKTNG